MAQNIFSAMELDAIGEMMNISLGSSATAVSNLLDHRVDITTPKVTVVPISEFTLGELEPAIGVEIKYVSGLEGSNIMLLKRSDVKAIVELLMGTEIPVYGDSPCRALSALQCLPVSCQAGISNWTWKWNSLIRLQICGTDLGSSP